MKNSITSQGFVSTGPLDGTNSIFVPELKPSSNTPQALVIDHNGQINATNSLTGSFSGSFSGVVVNPQFDFDTWNPILTFTMGGACSYLLHTGTYYRIGKLVHAFFDIQLSSKNSVTGSAYIGNMPYTSSNNTNTSVAGIVSVGTFQNMANNTLVAIAGHIPSNCLSASLHGIKNAQSDYVELDNTHFTNTSKITGMLTYLTEEVD